VPAPATQERIKKLLDRRLYIAEDVEKPAGAVFWGWLAPTATKRPTGIGVFRNMKPIETILFPVDLSDRGAKPAAQVGDWADRFGARLILLHVVDPADYFAEPDLHLDQVNRELPVMEERRVLDLDYFCTRYFGNRAIEKMVVRGGKAGEIVGTAQKRNVDLLMLPRDHQTLASRLFHDSLTARILNNSPIPVWTTEYLDAPSPLSVKHVLCAVHVEKDVTLDAANERLLDFARVIAGTFSSALTCLFVDEQGLFSGSTRESERDTGIAERRARIQDKMKDVADFEVSVGDIAASIHHTAERTSADLIILGRSRPGTVGFGIQIHSLIVNHVTHCPIISVL
jgi:nucleotide-binding universal stress UspA family protein